MDPGGIVKKFITSVLVALLLLVAGATPAHADNRAFQYSGTDKQTPTGFPSKYDITDVQMGITEDDEFQIYVSTKSTMSLPDLQVPAEFMLMIDTNLDKIVDFKLSSQGENSSATMSARDLLNGDGTFARECNAFGWLTSIGDAYGWEIPRSCLNPRETINFAVTSTVDGTALDRYPDGSSWWTVKTNYFKAEPCKSSLNGTKRTYLSKTYVCMKSGSTWKWLDWGPIAASKTKYVTEKAFYICNLGSKDGALLEDGGKTLTLEGVYKYILTESVFNCVTRTMAVPSSVLRKIAMTRALDGTLESKFGNVNLFWNYHPDNGLNITFSYN